MKFKFCGDLDCPDWALAAISLLTKLTSTKMRQLSQEVAKSFVDGNAEGAQKLCQEAKFSSEDTRVAIAVVEFFLSSAVKYAVTGDVFSSELQQLGFPKEHATSLSKVYQADASLAKVFANSGFRIAKLVDVQWIPDVLLDSPYPELAIRMSMAVKGPDQQVKQHIMLVSQEKFLILKHEVMEIIHVMEGIPPL